VLLCVTLHHHYIISDYSIVMWCNIQGSPGILSNPGVLGNPGILWVFQVIPGIPGIPGNPSILVFWVTWYSG
jgi:hypothetical protein